MVTSTPRPVTGFPAAVLETITLEDVHVAIVATDGSWVNRLWGEVRDVNTAAVAV
eukprot:CAMPEP_0175836304 /NCGR_PEP_ID=MMETSP0107_2-20121207/17071_1 /TAXON_ID=195067 ORGANISM="Goniomonas pacifica, Strain CCMP1869" /NCGR_SAMPLE_ID=MMETSP0107_2 /ASSEMBLY_ACC=CAM_ASM_000203 /LENGTH=54 /DNA_ID=CAMNT_0017149689 /DNA_START=817 /DNA_END=981 /DNA_ORIENTATION=-